MNIINTLHQAVLSYKILKTVRIKKLGVSNTTMNLLIEMDYLDLEEIETCEIEPQPNVDTQYDEYSRNNLNYSLYMNKGFRRQMLDRYFINQTQQSSVYAVFDGHGETAMSSDYVSQNLQKNIQTQQMANKTHQYPQIIKQAFHKTDQELHNYQKGYVDSGTTALWVEISINSFTVASLGDSQAIVVRKGGHHQILSTLHTPQSPLERSRIEQAGGWVLNIGNIPRTQGKLSVSRAFGNESIRKYLTTEPDVVVYQRHADDLAIIIATDGLWNILKVAEVAQIVEQNAQTLKESISKKIYEAAQVVSDNNIRDNVTILSVIL